MGDGGDCGAAKLKLAQAMHPGKLALIQAKKAAKSVRSKKAATAECAAGCPEYWEGDNWCDEACNVPACNMDGADCGAAKLKLVQAIEARKPVQGMQLVGFGYVAAACLVVVAAIPTIRSMRRKSENKPLLGEKVT